MHTHAGHESDVRTSIRDMIDHFDPERLDLVAIQAKAEDSYQKITYRELQSIVRSIGNALLSLGVKPGDHIGILSENRPEWPIAYVSAACIGAVAVPFDILLKVNELSTVMNAGTIKVLFVSRAHFDKVVEVESNCEGKKLPGLAHIICMDDISALREEVRSHFELTEALDSDELMKAFENKINQNSSPLLSMRLMPMKTVIECGARLTQQGRDLYQTVTVHPNDLCGLIFTSGTTGTPKGVLLSHSNLMANALGLKRGTVLGPGDNWIMVLPYHHVYPTILGVILPLYTYATITTVPTLRPNILIQTMQETGATCIPAVPVLIERIYKSIFTSVRDKGLLVSIVFYLMFLFSRFCYRTFHLKIGPLLFGSVRKQLGVPHLKFFISGAGPIPKRTIDGMAYLGLNVQQGYGLTETSPVISSTFPEADKPGTVGRPMFNVEVKIDNPDEMGNGELLTRGPHVFQGYLNQPELTAKVKDAEGWFHTGDVARMDKDGFITISGRMKNVIVTKGGKNIYPEEIEDKLLESEYISEVVVIPKEHHEIGEYPHAVIYPNFEALQALEKERELPFSEEELRDFIGREIKKFTSGLANYKSLRGFEITNEELPKTSSNKVRRFLFKKK